MSGKLKTNTSRPTVQRSEIIEKRKKYIGNNPKPMKSGYTASVNEWLSALKTTSHGNRSFSYTHKGK